MSVLNWQTKAGWGLGGRRPTQRGDGRQAFSRKAWGRGVFGGVPAGPPEHSLVFNRLQMILTNQMPQLFFISFGHISDRLLFQYIINNQIKKKNDNVPSFARSSVSYTLFVNVLPCLAWTWPATRHTGCRLDDRCFTIGCEIRWGGGCQGGSALLVFVVILVVALLCFRVFFCFTIGLYCIAVIVCRIFVQLLLFFLSEMFFSPCRLYSLLVVCIFSLVACIFSSWVVFP